MPRHPRVLPLLIAVGQPVVIVKPGVAVTTGIDAQLDRRGRVLAGVLFLWAQWENAASAHIKRQDPQWRVAMDRLAARDPLPSPEVIPVPPFGRYTSREVAPSRSPERPAETVRT